jgi:hypothetical protein
VDDLAEFAVIVALIGLAAFPVAMALAVILMTLSERVARIENGDDTTPFEEHPLWLRVLLCARCNWLDGVWEACPPLGQALDRLRRRLTR